MAGGRSACQGGLAAVSASGLARLMARQDEERAKRLAEALRENLRRRKAQARGEEQKILPGGEGDHPKDGGGVGAD